MSGDEMSHYLLYYTILFYNYTTSKEFKNSGLFENSMQKHLCLLQYVLK